MLPGFLLMLGLSVLYVEAGLDESLDEVFYGLKAAVGALVAIGGGPARAASSSTTCRSRSSPSRASC